MPGTLSLRARTRGALPLFELVEFGPWGVDAFITARAGGVSAPPYDQLNLGAHVGDDPARVSENRRRVAEAAGVGATQLVTSHQIHGARVNDLDDWRGEPLEGDAMVTTRDDLAMCVMVADCVPLLFVEPLAGRLAVAHAGWRGLVAGVIAATLAYFEDPGAVRVVVGPHVSGDGYQVGPEVAGHFVDIVGACRDDEGDRHRLDLGVVTRHQLARAGVLEDHVTSCLPHTDGGAVFFSDRAQRPCGRFALVARRRSYDATLREGSP